MKTMLFSLACVVSLSGCALFRSEPKGAEERALALLDLTSEQAEYLVKYDRRRKLVTDFLKLPQEATPEDIRVAAVTLLKLQDTRSGVDSWEEARRIPLVRMVCTEERRQKFARMYQMHQSATWVELGRKVDPIWRRFYKLRKEFQNRMGGRKVAFCLYDGYSRDTSKHNKYRVYPTPFASRKIGVGVYYSYVSQTHRRPCCSRRTRNRRIFRHERRRGAFAFADSRSKS